MRYVKSIMVFMLLAALLSSCNKWLELEPQDGVVSQEYWKTKEQVHGAVIGIYSSLLGNPDGTSGVTLAEQLLLWGELRADMLAASTGISDDEQAVINVNILPSNYIVSWAAVYRTISSCNIVIDNAPAVLSVDNTFTQQSLNAYLAEAKALRALMYFYLAKTFGEVPLLTKATQTDNDIVNVPKSSQGQVLAQVVKDLTEAEPGAVTTYGNRNSNAGRITRYTINTILADVYLWQEEYEKSITEADKVINSGQYGLVAGDAAWFQTLYVNGNSVEAIFEFQFDAQKLNTFYSVFATSRRRYVASAAALEDVFGIDYVNPDSVDIRGASASIRSSDNSVWKYVGLTYNAMRPQAESYAHWFVYRYADVLLIKAEALAQAGRGQQALDIIALIRQRAHAIEATYRSPAADDKEGITDYILEERNREFAYEGKRWYDLLRNARRNNYQRLSLLLNVVAKTVPVQLQQSALAKYQDTNSHYLPIHQSELLIDKSLVQNPFYR